VAVISEALAALHWPDGGALGGRLRLGDRDGVTRIATVVGIVDDVNYRRR